MKYYTQTPAPRGDVTRALTALPRDRAAPMVAEVDRYAAHRDPVAGVQLQPALRLVAVRIVRPDRAVVEAGLAVAKLARLLLRVHPLALVILPAVQIALGELGQLVRTANALFRAAPVQRVLVDAVLFGRFEKLETIDAGATERCWCGVAASEEGNGLRQNATKCSKKSSDLTWSRSRQASRSEFPVRPGLAWRRPDKCCH